MKKFIYNMIFFTLNFFTFLFHRLISSFQRKKEEVLTISF